MRADNLSLHEKVIRAFNLAMAVAKSGRALTTQDEDMVYGHYDGLVEKHLHKHRTGQCSLQATVDFDIGKEEAQIDADLARLRSLLGGVT